MTPERARSLAQLARIARRRAVDSPPLLCAYVAGLLARGPIDSAVLGDALEAAGIDESQWRETIAALTPRSLAPGRHTRRSAWLSRFLRGAG